MTGRAGFATEDITPEPGISLFGYHRPFPSSAVLDRLEVVATVLEAAGDLVVVITVDNVGMLVKDVDMVRRVVAAGLLMPPRPETASEVVRAVTDLYRESQAAVPPGGVQGASR